MKLARLYSLLVLLCASCLNASAKEANLILVNAKVWTENPAQPTAQAIALEGSHILAVGDNAAIRKLAGPDTRLIDLGGRLILPGFNDAHVHFMIGCGSLITVQLGTSNSRPNFASASQHSPKPCQKAHGYVMDSGTISVGIHPICPTTSSSTMCAAIIIPHSSGGSTATWLSRMRWH